MIERFRDIDIYIFAAEPENPYSSVVLQKGQEAAL
jgi:hypothetical protein